jgi:DNA-binding NarL/FixJ family response regulator
MVVRVVVAEDNLLVREGLTKLLSAQPELELAGTCEDYDGLFGLVDDAKPDVVVTDIRMPPTGTDEGIRAAAQLRQSAPSVGVVALSQSAEPEYALALFDSGSHGRAYLLKERVSDPEQLVAAIREVAAGGSVVDPAIVETLVRARAAKPASPIDRLTPREREVLAEMAQGKNNAAVAAALVLSERAVEKHINSVFSKLGLGSEPDVHRRVKAVLLFLAEQGG